MITVTTRKDKLLRLFGSMPIIAATIVVLVLCLRNLPIHVSAHSSNVYGPARGSAIIDGYVSASVRTCRTPSSREDDYIGSGTQDGDGDLDVLFGNRLGLDPKQVWLNDTVESRIYFPLVFTNDLVAYYPFNGNAIDKSGNEKDGTLYGEATWTDGIMGSALSLDGQDDYVSTPNFITQTQGTIEFWFLANTWGSGGGIVSSREGWGYEDGTLIVYDGEHNFDLVVMVIKNVVWQKIRTNQQVLPGQWYQVTFTWSEITGKRLYLNGELKNMINNADPVFLGIPLTIGRQGHYLGYRYFDGIIDELAIYRIALPVEEIQQHYQDKWKSMGE